MALPPATKRRASRPMVASAVRVDNRTPQGAYYRRWSMPWQERGLTYIDMIPELNYASRFYARMLKQLEIFPATLDEHGKKTPIRTGLPVEVLNELQDPGGGRSTWLGAYGRLMFVTGEGYLFGRDLESERPKWSFVWLDELIVTDDSILWRPNNQTPPVEYVKGSEAQAYRFWTPHPRRSGEADSPLRPAVEGGIAEELIILTASVRSTAVSRMTNGMTKVPQELSPGPIDPVGDEDPENDPFMEDMIEHAEAAVEDPGSAAASVGLIVTGAYEYLDRLVWMPTHDPQTDYMEKDLRKEAIERLAHGMDMPAEVLTGMAKTNHWAAKQIFDDVWRSHGAAIAEQLVDDIADAFLQPKLQEMGYADWQHTVVDYDASQILVAPDRVEDATTGAKLGYIGGKAWRQACNFDEADAQTPEEHEEWLAIQMRDAQILPESERPPARGPMPEVAPAKPDPSDGPPAPGPNGTSRQDGMSAQIIGAAQLAVVRCRELAGAKLRRYDRTCPDCLAPADGKPNALVASLIGADAIAQLKVDPRRLVQGGSESFYTLLLSWGVEDLTAKLICSRIEQHAADTLTTAIVDLPEDFAKVVNGYALAVGAA